MVEYKAYAEKTIAAYRWKAGEAIENWSKFKRPSRFLKRFAACLPTRGSILDYGCGIGGDMAWLISQGFRAEGIDGVLEFVEEARKRCPGARVAHARFERIDLPAAAYHGIWANASLIHVPADELERQLKKLKKALKPDGVLGMTLAWGSVKGFLEDDWIPGRFVTGYSKEKAAWFLRGWDLRSVEVKANSVRKGRWIEILAYNR
ncbi:MAG: class I SAM-dependent methyltransferase [Candidatus Omnitrophica bacterium]|nr:class I SAM-dependent methyltransferase [Candidatus Omnitrophota bacterium]